MIANMRSRQFQIAKLFGIPLIIDYSWPPIVLLHIWLISQFWLPARVHPPLPFWLNLLVGLVITLFFFASVVTHELAHSFIARLEGIRIHDIQLHIFGGWARLVGEPRTAMAELRVAVAGPVSSFLLCLLFTGGLLAVQAFNAKSVLMLAVAETCFYLAMANIFLAMFNLLPGLPLDGGRALRAFLWHRSGDILAATRMTKRMGVGIAYMLISYGLFLIVQGMWRGRFWQDFLLSVWLLVVGVFLKNAAESDYRHRQQQAAATAAAAAEWKVTGTAGALMHTPVVAVSPKITVSEFVDDVLAHHRQTNFAVAENGQLHGVLSLATLRNLPREQWPKVKVGGAMEPIKDDLFVTVRTPVEQAESKIKTNELGFLAVVDQNGVLVGELTPSDFAGVS